VFKKPRTPVRKTKAARVSLGRVTSFNTPGNCQISAVKRREKRSSRNRPSSAIPRPSSLIVFTSDLRNRTDKFFSGVTQRARSSDLLDKAEKLFGGGSAKLTMDLSKEIRLNNNTLIPMENFSTRLDDYNSFFSGKPEQLRQRMTKNGDLILDGMLNIYWGLKKSIVLGTGEDDDEKKKESKRPSKEFKRRSNTRRNLMPVTESGETNQQKEDELPSVTNQSLPITSSTSVRLRKAVSRNKAFRASVNGHFYKLETSVFTPTYGSVTKVRVTSTNDTQDVIKKLFQKFKVENSPDEFSLYIHKESQERREMPVEELPLLRRVLMGPNEKLGKIFIMEKKACKNITSEVAQYLKMNPNILRILLSKFTEEERSKIVKLRKRYEFYRKMLMKRIHEETKLQQSK